MPFQGTGSISKRFGIKVQGGLPVKAGQIIIRQRGRGFIPMKNVGMGKDFTIFALKDGVVKFHGKRRVSVITQQVKE